MPIGRCHEWNKSKPDISGGIFMFADDFIIFFSGNDRSLHSCALDRNHDLSSSGLAHGGTPLRNENQE